MQGLGRLAGFFRDNRFLDGYGRGLLVALCAFGIYAGTLSHELVWDDNVLLVRVRTAGFPAVLTQEFLREGSGYYRPLVLASLWLDDRLAPVFPPIYHLTNVLLHAGNSFLVHRLLVALLSPAAALWGALLFALHPASAEAVAFVSGRTDLWATFFVLLLALRWLALRRNPSARPWLAWGAWAGLFVLGGLSKETTFMLPLVLLAWGFALGQGREGGWRGWWLANRGWVSASVAGVLLLLVVRVGIAHVGFGLGVARLDAGTQVAAVNKLTLIPAILPTYFRILVWPWPLTAYYTPHRLHLDAATLAATSVLLGGGLLAAGRSSHRAGILGLAWLCGFLLPVSGAVRIIGSVVAERFLYLPAAGFAMIFGALVVRLGEQRWGRRASVAAAGVVLLVFATLTVRQSGVWRNETALFEHTLRFSPEADPVKMSLASVYLRAGRVAEASRLEGDVYSKLGFYPKAIEVYRRIFASTGSGDAGDHLRLGRAYFGAQRYPEAVVELSQAASGGRAEAGTWDLLGLAQRGAGDPAAAERAFREALRVDADHAPALLHLGEMLTSASRETEALPLLERYVALEPRSADGWNDLGLVLFRERRIEEAIRAFQRAVSLEDADAMAHSNLALAYSAGGSGEEALRELKRVRELDPGLALILEGRLRATAPAGGPGR